ncbi:hypothetical protein NB640_11600 [Oxalobacter vibrioformis]|uniref:Uncharacterized protein n=1 Tax=Oxalobacter vibrioformis TaxID=933080 RepID=A0A9E9LZS9_9BURK|nr:hypothetical protein [Oxalobacter vibrioformis]WAW09848.1 hypothetical protein NB640_11600 [Oxalobacter vibrioformis]
MFEQDNTSRPRDLPGPEKYWGDSQWRIHRTMKDMGILSESDNLTIPAHIAAEPGKVAAETAAFFSAKERQKPDFLFGEDTGVTVPKKSPVEQSSPLFGEADQADRATLWKRAAKAAGPGNTDTGDPTGGIGKLLDDYGKNHRVSQWAEQKASGTAAPYKAGGLASGSGSVVKRNLSPDVSVATQPPVTRPENERYAEGLRFLGPDPEDRMNMARDILDASRATRAGSHIATGFALGGAKVASKAGDLPINSYNIYNGHYVPVEHLSPEEIAEADKQNARQITPWSNVVKEGEKGLRSLMEMDTQSNNAGNATLSGEIAKKGSEIAYLAPEAALETWGGRLVNGLSLGLDASNAALKTYHEKMLAFRHWRDEDICDPVKNPIFGSWCQKKLRSGRDLRSTAMDVRQHIALLHALKEATIPLGVGWAKKRIGRATGHAGESSGVRLAQNMELNAAAQWAEDIRETYGDDVLQKGLDIMDNLIRYNEWHMHYF